MTGGLSKWRRTSAPGPNKGYGRLTVHTLAVVVAYVMLVLAAFLSLVGNDMIKKMWFIPGILRSLQIMSWLGGYQFQIGRMFAEGSWPVLVFYSLETAAVFFAGRWFKNDMEPEKAGPEIGAEEKLRLYKDLFDAGAILQDEFEARKKEIIK